MQCSERELVRPWCHRVFQILHTSVVDHVRFSFIGKIVAGVERHADSVLKTIGSVYRIELVLVIILPDNAGYGRPRGHTCGICYPPPT